MTATAFGSPDRGTEANGSVPVFPDPPMRATLLDQRSLDRIAAAAGAQESSVPAVPALTHQVNSARLEPVRQLADADGAVKPTPAREP